MEIDWSTIVAIKELSRDEASRRIRYLLRDKDGKEREVDSPLVVPLLLPGVWPGDPICPFSEGG